MSNSATTTAVFVPLGEQVFDVLSARSRYQHNPFGLVTETDIIYKVAVYKHDSAAADQHMTKT